VRKRKLHQGEVDVDVDLVRRLVAVQFPEWACLSIHEVESMGTVNAIYRLGTELCVRLPRVEAWAGDLVKELQWLPRLAPRLPLAVPEPVADGAPALGYPFRWAVYRWLDGEPLAPDSAGRDGDVAEDLGRFVSDLQRIDPTGAPRSSRDRPLETSDAEVRAAIESLRGVLDTEAVTAAWERALRSPAWGGSPVWTHGDLLPSNLLVVEQRLGAVIDFGSVGVGDPAVDVIPAWSVLAGDARVAFRDAVDVDDATWARARGLALHQALMIIPYYPETNPGFVALAMHTVGEIVADLDQ
jgi:aminoglycoside phosphotransferase (APT) family kinase protein